MGFELQDSHPNLSMNINKGFIPNPIIEPPVAPSTLLDGIIAYWKADTNGSFPDSVGSNDGTIYGPTFDSNGKIGGCYDFDGSNDYIAPTSELISSGQTRTYSFWANPNTVAGGLTFSSTNPRIFYVGAIGISQRISMDLLGGAISIIIFSQDLGTYYGARTNEIVVANQWQHIVFVIKPNSKFKIYLDGVLQTNSLRDQVLASTWSSQTDYSIGGQATQNQRYFNGGLDEIGEWNRELTQTEITELYNSSNGNQYPFT